MLRTVPENMTVPTYEVIRTDSVYTWILLRTENYRAAKELHDWFKTYMSCFTYKLRQVS